jgi:hypothetical protein
MEIDGLNLCFMGYAQDIETDLGKNEFSPIAISLLFI